MPRCQCTRRRLTARFFLPQAKASAIIRCSVKEAARAIVELHVNDFVTLDLKT